MNRMEIGYIPDVSGESFRVMMVHEPRENLPQRRVSLSMDRRAVVAFTEQILTALHEQEVHEARLLDALIMPGEGHHD